MKRSIWASRDQKSRYSSNNESLKGSRHLQMGDGWLFPICSGPERLKDDDGRKAHPTQKPEALIIDLTATSNRRSRARPVFGTGTTGAVAKRLGRRCSASSATPITPRLLRNASRPSSPTPRVPWKR